MNKRQYDYLMRLAELKNRTKDDFERTVFDIVCCAYQSYLLGKRQTKYVEKEHLLQVLVSKGFLTSRIEGKLPDDRRLRETCRNLLKRGYPIMASSVTNGYFIADDVSEVQQPMNENHKRALEILAAERGYKTAIQFMLGQSALKGVENG